MNEYYRYRRVCRLSGWSKWLPFLLVPFFVLVFEVCLHTRMREHDYQLSQIRGETRALQASVRELKAQKAELEQMDTIQAQALEMGLKVPEANQITVVYLTGDSLLDEHMEPMDLASLNLGGGVKPSGLGALQPLE
jgi:hypothetical protein